MIIYLDLDETLVYVPFSLGQQTVFWRPGLYTLMDALTEANHTMRIATMGGREYAEAVLKEAQIRDYIDEILSLSFWFEDVASREHENAILVDDLPLYPKTQTDRSAARSSRVKAKATKLGVAFERVLEVCPYKGGPDRELFRLVEKIAAIHAADQES